MQSMSFEDAVKMANEQLPESMPNEDKLGEVIKTHSREEVILQSFHHKHT